MQNVLGLFETDGQQPTEDLICVFKLNLQFYNGVLCINTSVVSTLHFQPHTKLPLLHTTLTTSLNHSKISFCKFK